jgi:hypothetical protein
MMGRAQPIAETERIDKAGNLLAMLEKLTAWQPDAKPQS